MLRIRFDHYLTLDIGPLQKMYAVADSKVIENRLLAWTFIAADTRHPMHHPDVPAIFPVYSAQLPQIVLEEAGYGPVAEERANQLFTDFAKSLVDHISFLAKRAGEGPLLVDYAKGWESWTELLVRSKRSDAAESRAATFMHRRLLAEELFNMSNVERRLELLNVDKKARLEIQIATFYNFARACVLRDARQAMWHYIERLHRSDSEVLEIIFKVRPKDSEAFISQLADHKSRNAISPLQNLLVRIKRTNYLGKGTVLLPNDYWSAPSLRRSKEFTYGDD